MVDLSWVIAGAIALLWLALPAAGALLLVRVARGGSVRPGPDGEIEAVCTGTVLDFAPGTVQVFGGPVDDGRVKLAIERLEFRARGVRLRTRPLLPPRRAAIRDIRYQDVTELALLAEPRRRRKRGGIRLRTAPGELPVYFLTGAAAAQQLIDIFARHGVELTGQVTPRRLPYSLSRVYPENDLEPPAE